MKLRLLEYLTCPDHPDEFLQLRMGHVAKLFDHAVEVETPLCRYYCALAQGRLEDLPMELTPDCQTCISMELQRGFLTCPVCGGFYALYEGVPVLSKFFPASADTSADRLVAEFRFGDSKIVDYRRRGPFAKIAGRREAGFIAENIKLPPIDSVLYLGGATTSIIDLFCERDMEVVVASEEPHELLRIHEREMVNPSRLEFFVVTNPDLNGLRAESFDLVISGYRLYGPHGYIPPAVGDIARPCNKSGTIAMILYKDNYLKRIAGLCEGQCGRMKERSHTLDEFKAGLPESMRAMDMETHSSNLFDLLVLQFPKTEPEEVKTIFHGDEAEAMINA